MDSIFKRIAEKEAEHEARMDQLQARISILEGILELPPTLQDAVIAAPKRKRKKKRRTRNKVTGELE